MKEDVAQVDSEYSSFKLHSNPLTRRRSTKTTGLQFKRPNPDSMETCVEKNVELIENPLSKHRKQSVEAYLQKKKTERKTSMAV